MSDIVTLMSLQEVAAAARLKGWLLADAACVRKEGGLEELDVKFFRPCPGRGNTGKGRCEMLASFNEAGAPKVPVYAWTIRDRCRHCGGSGYQGGNGPHKCKARATGHCFLNPNTGVFEYVYRSPCRTCGGRGVLTMKYSFWRKDPDSMFPLAATLEWEVSEIKREQATR